MNAKAERFKKLFPKRAERITEAVRILGNCSSKNYEYNQEHVMRAFGALLREYIKCAALYGVTVTAQVDGIEVRVIDS